VPERHQGQQVHTCPLKEENAGLFLFLLSQTTVCLLFNSTEKAKLFAGTKWAALLVLACWYMNVFKCAMFYGQCAVTVHRSLKQTSLVIFTHAINCTRKLLLCRGPPPLLLLLLLLFLLCGV
jgi:hypothetical protein